MAHELPVVALSFESRFPLKQVGAWLLPSGVSLGPTSMHKTYAVFDVGGGSTYAFDFGALVFIGVNEEAQRQVLAAVQAKLPREPHPPLREDLLVEVREGAGAEIHFDRVVVGELTGPARDVIATVVAQSTAIDYYDEDIETMLERIGAISSEVARRGKIAGRASQLVRFIGATVASQVEIISAIALLDKPDLTWEDEAVDRLHDRLRNHFEIPERHKALETKLAIVRGAMEVFLEIGQTRRAMLLEATIVLLILVEIVLGLLRVL